MPLLEGDIDMPEEPTPRAQFNVWVGMLLLTTLFCMGLTIWGLAGEKLDFAQALAAWIGPVTGGGAVWAYGRLKS